MKFAIYCRKSKFTGRGESIENQFDYCKKYIDFYFNQSENEIFSFFDEGYSGKNLERPSFQEMLKECKSHSFDYVVVYRLDRISRNVSDFANLYQNLLDLNIGFISASEKYDTSTSGGRAMLFMSCVFAQLERETVSERVRDNMYSLAKTGRWLGGNTPTGFNSIQDTSPKIKFNLTPNEDIQLVKLLYKKYLESKSLSYVENLLYECGIKSPNGNSYSKSSIKGILENPVYCQSDRVSYEYLKELGCNMFCTPKDCNNKGYIAYGRTSSQKRMDYSHWIISIGEHNGIISSNDWITVHRNLHKNRHFETVHNSNSLLSGLIYCPNCNHKMISRTKSKGFVYSCSWKLQHGVKACQSKNIDSSLDTKLIEEIFSYFSPTDSIIPELQALKKDIHNNSVDIQKEILLKKLSKYKKLLLNLDNTSLTFKEISKEYEDILKSLNTLDNNILDISNINIHDILIQGFNSLPIHIKRNFLKDVIPYLDLNF